jgi:hypothetical protein
MLEVARVVQRLGLGVDGFHERLVPHQDLSGNENSLDRVLS